MKTRLLRRHKIITTAASAMLLGAAFQPAGCSFSIDQQLLDSLTNVLSNLDFGPPFGPRHGGFGDACDELGCEQDDDSPDMDGDAPDPQP